MPAAVLAVCLCLQAVRAQAAQVEAHRDGEAIVVSAVAEVAGDRRVAWEVLTGYERYPEFVPDLRSTRVTGRSERAASLEQRGTAGWLFYRVNVFVALSVVEEPFERVHSVSTGGDFREFSGTYRLLSTADGIRLEYSGRMVPAFRLPPLIGLPALRAMVGRQFEGMVREIERRSATVPERQ